MTNPLPWVKRYPLLAVFLVGVFYLLTRMMLNASGFCWAEKRWLSDEEMKLRYMQYSPSSSTLEQAIIKAEEYPYCCHISRRKVPILDFSLSGLVGLKGGNAIVYRRLLGEGKGVELIKSKEPIPPYEVEYITLSNCGKPGTRYGETIYK